MDSLAHTPTMEPTVSETSVVKWRTPSRELDGMASYIRAFLAEKPQMHEKSVLVIVPNRAWALLAKKALRRHRFDVTLGGVRLGLPGSKHPGTPSAKQTHHLLELLSQPEGSSAAAGLTGEERAFYEQKVALRGFSLARAVGLEALKDYEEVLERMAGDEKPSELLALFESAALHPVFSENPRAIRIATLDYEPIYEARDSYELIWIPGAVEGFIPPASASPDTANAQSSAYYGHFSRALGMTHNKLFVSYFSQIEEDKAKRLGLPFTRTRNEEGTTFALIKPSPYIMDPAFALPGSVGGQALLDALRH